MALAFQSKRFVTYLRVSTSKQELSGLGLEAQRQVCAQYLTAAGGSQLAEFIETESGRTRLRPQLSAALTECRKRGATSLIAKLDRLARNVAFVSSLMEGGVDFLAADAPYANRLMIHILAAFAEHEREQIAQRTREALAAAKARGVVLGANGRVLADKYRAEAVRLAAPLREPVTVAIANGARTLGDIASALNVQGYQTREGCDWRPGTVHRLLERLQVRLKSQRQNKI